MRIPAFGFRRPVAAPRPQPRAVAPRPADSFTPAAGPRAATAAARATAAAQAADVSAVKTAYQTHLNREPSAAELDKAVAFAGVLHAQGKTDEELRNSLAFVIALSPEWQSRDAYRNSLGREPSADELKSAVTFATSLTDQGKSVEEMRAGLNFVIAMSPEWQSKSAYNDMLGRAASPEELANATTFATSLRDQGKSVEEMRAGLNFVIAMGPEWQSKSAYNDMLGRAPSPEELANAVTFATSLRDQGKSVEEMRAGLNFVIALSPEWQEAHRPKVSLDRDAIYLQQPNGWSCGPTSLSMALAASGVRGADQGTVWEMVDALGARAGVGTPGGVALIADVARRMGVNAEANGSRDAADMRAALERGHGIVVNGDIGGGGHFIYIAGLDMAGNFIVCDPWRPGITSWGDGELEAFTHFGNNPPGFAEIWPN